MGGRQSENQKRQRPAVLGPEHDVESTEVTQRVRQDYKNVEFLEPGKPNGSKYRERGVEKKEQGGEDRGALKLERAVKLRIPAPEIDLAEKERNGSEPAPVAAHFDQQQSRT